MIQKTMDNYSELEEKIGVKFKDHLLVKTAFVHKSYINEHKGEDIAQNERMEFLGDAILEFVSTKELYQKFPNSTEGELTAYRSALVKGKNLAKVAKEIGLGQYLFLSKGEEKSGGREKDYLLANTVEALIGAIFLDLGIDVAQEFIKRFILSKMDEILEKNIYIDAKSRFQEMAQEKEEYTPYYEVIKEEGPDHRKKFTMGVYIKGELIAEGVGTSKQKAEDDAAQNALTKLGW